MWLVAALVALLHGARVAWGSPIGDSLVAVAGYEALMPFSQTQVVAAMANSSGVRMPTLQSLSANQLSALRSSNRKMTPKQASARLSALRTFFAQTYPGISLDTFYGWSLPMYQTYVHNLGLQGAPHMSNVHYLRAVLLGMTAVNVILNGGVVNHFAVLDPAETVYFTGLAGLSLPTQKSDNSTMDDDAVRRLLSALPAAYDMRDSGKMPPIRDQMQCGSCWAFTTSSSLEIQNIFLNGNGDVGELSEQMLVSCNVYGAYANQGCRGGVIQYAYSFIHAQGGLPLRSRYPYTDYVRSSVATPMCDASLTSPKALQCDGRTVYLPTTSESSTAAQVRAAEAAIMQMVVAGYPVTIQIAGSSRCFQSYGGGLLTCACGKVSSKDPIDHAILVIGYTPTYFVARNQWGTSWGENGYIRLPRLSANPQLGLPATGQCNMLAGPLVAGDVQQLQSTSTSPSTAPSPRLDVGASCPSKKVACGSAPEGKAKTCCKKLCAWGQCSRNVCCPNGKCAVLVHKSKRTAFIVCQGGGGNGRKVGVLKRSG